MPKSNKIKMIGAGKYVRAPPAAVGNDEESEVGRFVRAPNYGLPIAEEAVDDHYADYSTAARDYQKELEDRVLELENIIKGTRSGARQDSRDESPVEATCTPTTPYIAPVLPSPTRSASGTSGAVIRWDNIKPFPKNVPATKMWEAWTRFHEDFEMAASLSNLNDPRRRVEYLLLSMGDELKSIVRAAKLRPSVK